MTGQVMIALLVALTLTVNCASARDPDSNGGLTIHSELKPLDLSTKTEPPKPQNPKELSLCEACNKGNYRLVMQLVNEGVPVNISCSGSLSPLIWAAHRGHEVIAWFLLEHGADPNFAPPYTPPALFSALRLRQENPLFGHPENAEAMVALLLRHKADSQAVNLLNETPLMFAAGRGDLEMVLVLLKNGVDINARSPKGDTALSYARKRGQLEVVRALLDLGAK